MIETLNDRNFVSMSVASEMQCYMQHRCCALEASSMCEHDVVEYINTA